MNFAVSMVEGIILAFQAWLKVKIIYCLESIRKVMKKRCFRTLYEIFLRHFYRYVQNKLSNMGVISTLFGEIYRYLFHDEKVSIWFIAGCVFIYIMYVKICTSFFFWNHAWFYSVTQLFRDQSMKQITLEFLFYLARKLHCSIQQKGRAIDQNYKRSKLLSDVYINNKTFCRLWEVGIFRFT